MTGRDQLDRLRAELDDADARAARLAASCTPASWQMRAADGGWAPSECVQHVVLSADAMLERMDAAIASGQATPRTGDAPFAAGILGRVLLWALEPPYRRLRTRTTSAFVPSLPRNPDADVQALCTAHDRARVSLERARPLALDRLTIVSPFDPRVRYNLYAAFALLAVHARRHLWQGEQALASHVHMPSSAVPTK